jgi:hypothetical protein
MDNSAPNTDSPSNNTGRQNLRCGDTRDRLAVPYGNDKIQGESGSASSQNETYDIVPSPGGASSPSIQNTRVNARCPKSSPIENGIRPGTSPSQKEWGDPSLRLSSYAAHDSSFAGDSVNTYIDGFPENGGVSPTLARNPNEPRRAAYLLTTTALLASFASARMSAIDYLCRPPEYPPKAAAVKNHSPRNNTKPLHKAINDSCVHCAGFCFGRNC